MASYEWQQHTNNIKLIISGRDMEEIFQQGALAIAQFFCATPPTTGEKVEKVLQHHTTTYALLLVDFLSDLIAKSTLEKACFTQCSIKLTKEIPTLIAAISGYRTGALNDQLKKATYHDAQITKQSDGNYEAVVVFDI